jgi:AcrR family transcriptional regulator
MAEHTNRRNDLLSAALEAFVDRGYEGTSVADLAKATGLSKAAFVYHFDSKEALLFELATPLLDDLDSVIDRDPCGGPADLKALVGAYLDVLCAHRDTAEWIDGDKSVLNHGDLGKRLDANNQRAHRLLTGPDPTDTSIAQASAVLGMLWRPVRNGYLPDDPAARQAIVKLATTAATAV